MDFRAWAPGRVNLIGEHTDYTGGLVFPMAIQLGTAITGERRGDRLVLRSDAEPDALDVGLPLADASSIEPRWGRYPAGVAAVLGATTGMVGAVSSTVPPGAGLSSSAALEVATALALGAGDTLDLRGIAEVAQRAEQEATGVPCGIMDQLASAAGVAGHALLIDCATLDIEAVPLPDDLRVVVVHSGQERRLADSAYEQRRDECEAAEAVIGPLRAATLCDVDRIDDEVARKRARHVIGENFRVRNFATALRVGDRAAAGALMNESHASLRDDFEVSTPVLDDLVAHLRTIDGVFGARLTGAGFGGCVVAVCRPDVDPIPAGLRGWVVEASAGAFLG